MAGEVRARVAVVTAGAWAPTLVGVDATPTRETTSYFSLDEPVPSVIEPNGGSAHGYALAAPGIGMKAGLAPVGADGRSGRAGRAGRGDRGADGGLGGTALPRDRSEPTRVETCLYTRRANDEFLLERKGRIVVGSPCSGHGFKFAPLFGKRLAALALEAL